MGLADRLIVNTLSSCGLFAVRFFVSFFLAAYVLGSLGGERYGVFVLLEAMVSTLAILDLAGVEGSFVHFLAAGHAAGDRAAVNRVLTLGFVYYLLFQLFLAVLILLLHRPLLHLFHFDGEITGEIFFVLGGLLFISVVRGSFRVFRSALIGMQRLDIANRIDLILLIPNVVATVWLLDAGYGLRGLVLVGCLTALLTVALHLASTLRLAPWIRPGRPSLAMIRNLGAYGLKVQAARMAEMLNMQLDKLLIGALLPGAGKTLVGFYELGAKPARVIRDLPSQLLPAILPAASLLDAGNRRDAMLLLYRRGSRYLILCTVPLVGFCCLHGDLLIRFWLGAGYPEVVSALRILVVGYACTVLSGMGRLIARGCGLPDFEMHSSLAATAANLACSAVLILLFGFRGALFGSAVAAAVGALWFLTAFHRHLGEPFWRQTAAALYPMPLLATGLALAASLLPVPAPAGDGRMATGLLLCGRGLVFAAVYLFFLKTIRYFDQADSQLLGRGFALLRRAHLEEPS
ncbi:MAG: oligosaccharide flippase family protein [Thermodesulfobacteriota bacterium]